MKVFQICSYYAGGVFYTSLFQSMLDLGIDNDIYVFTDKNNKLDQSYPTNVVLSRPYYKIDRFIFHLKHSKVLKDALERFDIASYDLMHAHSLFSNGFIACQLKKQFHIPYVVAVRSSDLHAFFRFALHLKNIGLEILREADRVIFISDPLKQELFEKYIPEAMKSELLEKSIVIPNGVHHFWIDNALEEPKTHSGKGIRFLHTGDVNRNKNILTTLSVCQLLKNRGYDPKLTVIGKIKSRFVGNKVLKSPFVTYHEFLPKEKLIDYHRASDIYIMPSIRETFGISYLEAISQGSPVIYSKGQGFDQHFEDGFVGYPVESRNAEEIADRVENILSNYDTLSKHCLEATQISDWDSVATRYHHVYQDILSLQS